MPGGNIINRMISQEQTRAFEEFYERLKSDYSKERNKSNSLECISNSRVRCIALIKPVDIKVEGLGEIGGLYIHETPHFTLDCHRYLIPNKLPEDINEMSLEEQKRRVITPEELELYQKILTEECLLEQHYELEAKGVSFGPDGLVVQAYSDYERMQRFNDRLGERVRREIPSMDFQWGVVKNRIPVRAVFVARFTGKEDRKQVLRFVEQNRDKNLGLFDIDYLHLILSDHYVQNRNTLELGSYRFSR